MGRHSTSSSSKTFSSSQGKHSNAGGSGSKTKTVWYCSYCRFGPLNIQIDEYCPDCQHKRCSSCTVTTIEYNPGR
ncbi:uncharacterized protein B0T23DRAFT_406383 [Neurospora hispaniola]|uniref:Uncharacterized protein n=1 Tax=Neurospora hispaniola TaxID=588809 RepID=A0AAJ0MPC4_9PEZI|nr:hypothetical protein B0T23DRAFT_406383 [Neurospora hispaniola]